MTLSDVFEKKLRDTAEWVTREKRGYDLARSYREDLIRMAAAAGGTYREIAVASGVSYQRVAQIVTGEPPPGLPWDAPREIACPECGAQPGESCPGVFGARFHQAREDTRMQMFKAEHPEVG